MSTSITYIKAILYIAKNKPRRIGRAELAGVLKGCVRTQQRALKEMTKEGFLICDDCSPAGYKVNEEKFKDLIGYE